MVSLQSCWDVFSGEYHRRKQRHQLLEDEKAALRKAAQAELERSDATCNLCGSKEFTDMGVRPLVKCAKCNSLERTRAIKLLLDHHGLLKPGTRILHLAPDKGLAQVIYDIVGDSYVAADIAPERFKDVPNMKFIDLCKPLDEFGFMPNSFDIVLHSHVLEHIPCNWTISLKNMNDLLVQGGYHVCCIPISKGHYEESLAKISASEATRRFGQHDHVRRFGVDDLQRTLGMVAPIPEEYDLTQLFPSETLSAHNIPVPAQKGYSPHSVTLWKKEEFLL